MFWIGEVEVTVWLVLGYMSVDMVYIVDGVVFVGDMLFMLDVGSVCVDFFGGDVNVFYCSMCRLLDLLGEMWMFVCYDYLLVGCDLCWEIIVVE